MDRKVTYCPDVSWAYYNTYCEQEQWAWTCSLCGTLNGLSSQAITRYSLPESCPENVSSFIDLELPMEEAEEMQARPVYVAAVDLACKFLVLIVDTCKDRIASALETLRPTTSWGRNSGAGQGLDGAFLCGRGFGSAMEALFNYLGSEYGNTFALEFFSFLSGAPDIGAGQLDTRRYGEQYASRREDADLALLPEQTPFYKDLAAVAVQSGICVDILAVTNEYTDLASLKFLSIESGGSLFLYTSTDDSTLPQDMNNLDSKQFERMDNCTIIACWYCLWKWHTSELPMLQIAFQYTVVVPSDELANAGSNSTTRTKHSLKRRLRIRTLQFGVAHSINEIYDIVDSEVVLLLLVHKVILASLEQGVKEGRMLLHDWLVILTAQYNDACKLIQSGHGGLTGVHIDVAFSQCPQLQPLPRLVFALLRNPLLRVYTKKACILTTEYIFSVFLETLLNEIFAILQKSGLRDQSSFNALEPSSLSRAIYPLLTSYASLDKQAYPRHSLSRAALITSGSPVFFLDAFTNLIVFYASTADPSLPFPPPQDCLLRTTINKLKQERCITPKLSFIKGGQDDATAFENYLIEEQDVEGTGFTSVMDFVSFLEEINQSTLEYLK
ncbi:hypothetical protein RND71_020808 [Anisodus tanguticus]|uniref:Sec23/sec24 transport family protein n=1 Tax=Anisodus tanguticus TaxID=243964 RepID=A0AAE1RWK9_9SOLA|nr:hypothetical protein RND71_020808 [Anisodus tanguticus]